jgi:beta-catenin-like protein 1
MVNSLKQLLLSFEKKITKNQKMRVKHYDEPEKFMVSELELHAAIGELDIIAASPELYPILIEGNSMRIILGMITHENTDISLASVQLLDELLDPSVIAEVEEAWPIVDDFLRQQGLELIVQNLLRLDESSEEDAQGVHNTFSLIESLVDLRASVAKDICKKTHILTYLLKRLRPRKCDANKLYASELLSILLQQYDSNLLRVSLTEEVDGLDELLQAVAPFRKREPESAEEMVRHYFVPFMCFI